MREDTPRGVPRSARYSKGAERLGALSFFRDAMSRVLNDMEQSWHG